MSAPDVDGKTTEITQVRAAAGGMGLLGFT
jgi:hypothetical protein